MRLWPVGVVRSPTLEPSLVAESNDLSWRARADRATKERNTSSEIVIDESLRGILDGIEDFSHILVLYWAHRVRSDGRSITRAHPMGRKDLPLVGIFATCSPARPNPICATVARLLKRRGNLLEVEGLDAIDGTPVLDIKPYNPSYFPTEEVKIAPWLEQIHRDIAADTVPDTDSDESQQSER